MNRRGMLARIGLAATALAAPSLAACEMKPREPTIPEFLPAHPDFAKAHTVMKATEFRQLAATVDELVRWRNRSNGA